MGRKYLADTHANRKYLAACEANAAGDLDDVGLELAAARAVSAELLAKGRLYRPMPKSDEFFDFLRQDRTAQHYRMGIRIYELWWYPIEDRMDSGLRWCEVLLKSDEEEDQVLARAIRSLVDTDCASIRVLTEGLRLHGDPAEGKQRNALAKWERFSRKSFGISEL